jgi:hypothetical protein
MTASQWAAYYDGFHAGKSDRLLGTVCRLASVSFDTEPEYWRYYSAGYRYARFAAATYVEQL